MMHFIINLIPALRCHKYIHQLITMNECFYFIYTFGSFDNQSIM